MSALAIGGRAEREGISVRHCTNRMWFDLDNDHSQEQSQEKEAGHEENPKRVDTEYWHGAFPVGQPGNRRPRVWRRVGSNWLGARKRLGAVQRSCALCKATP